MIQQPDPFGGVLVNTVDEEAVMFYSPDMFPDPSKLKDRFELKYLYTADQMRAYKDAALELAAMIVQENAEHCRGPIRSILLANADAIRSAKKNAAGEISHHRVPD